MCLLKTENHKYPIVFWWSTFFLKIVLYNINTVIFVCYNTVTYTVLFVVKLFAVRFATNTKIQVFSRCVRPILFSKITPRALDWLERRSAVFAIGILKHRLPQTLSSRRRRRKVHGNRYIKPSRNENQTDL